MTRLNLGFWGQPLDSEPRGSVTPFKFLWRLVAILVALSALKGFAECSMNSQQQLYGTTPEPPEWYDGRSPRRLAVRSGPLYHIFDVQGLP